jgi:hypothetical protein
MWCPWACLSRCEGGEEAEVKEEWEAEETEISTVLMEAGSEAESEATLGAAKSLSQCVR